MTFAPVLDPGSLSPNQWATRLAALTRHGHSEDDPDVVECRTGLAYWRCRRVIDKERSSLAPQHIPALADMLRHAHRAVPA